jgi:hypothetical protein
VLVISLIGTGAAAQEGVAVTTDPVPAAGYNQFVIGGQLRLGMAHLIGDNDEAKIKFAGGGMAYFDFYLMEMLAIEAGLGLVGKGARYDEGEVTGRASGIYLEIPLGVKLNIHNVRIGVFIALNLGLTGKTKMEMGGQESEDDWDWDHYRRFNLGPKISIGYAIPVGPVWIVPGIDWSLHLLNEYYDMPSGFDDSIRAMNIMFHVGVEFAL